MEFYEATLPLQDTPKAPVRGLQLKCVCATCGGERNLNRSETVTECEGLLDILALDCHSSNQHAAIFVWKT